MTMKAETAFKSSPAHDWTPERVGQLGTDDIRQLRSNAERLGATAVVVLCDEALKARPKARGKRASGTNPPKHARHLISREKAFQARGAYLRDSGRSWSAVRKSDGVVVMSLWAAAIVTSDGTCSQLLWAPNNDGSRPWSDEAAGKERLDHCKLALSQGSAEGLLVHGERLEGHAPEDKARSVYGVDPELVVHFRVERRGDEYWAVWGEKANERAL
jgi:hypothetical protein